VTAVAIVQVSLPISSFVELARFDFLVASTFFVYQASNNQCCLWWGEDFTMICELAKLNPNLSVILLRLSLNEHLSTDNDAVSLAAQNGTNKMYLTLCSSSVCRYELWTTSETLRGNRESWMARSLGRFVASSPVLLPFRV